MHHVLIEKRVPNIDHITGTIIGRREKILYVDDDKIISGNLDNVRSRTYNKYWIYHLKRFNSNESHIIQMFKDSTTLKTWYSRKYIFTSHFFEDDYVLLFVTQVKRDEVDKELDLFDSLMIKYNDMAYIAQYSEDVLVSNNGKFDASMEL